MRCVFPVYTMRGKSKEKFEPNSSLEVGECTDKVVFKVFYIFRQSDKQSGPKVNGKWMLSCPKRRGVFLLRPAD